MSELKTQRMFLAVVAVAIMIFGGMIFLFQITNATSVENQGKCSINEPCNNLLQASGNNQNKTTAAVNGQAQDIYIKALSSGTYDNREVTVKKGVPVNLHFSAEQGAGCGRYLKVFGMDNVNALSKNGEEVVVNFTPQKEGTFEYSCGMRMFRPGKLVVVP